jgi:hypothetical protein
VGSFRGEAGGRSEARSIGISDVRLTRAQKFFERYAAVDRESGWAFHAITKLKPPPAGSGRITTGKSRRRFLIVASGSAQVAAAPAACDLPLLSSSASNTTGDPSPNDYF